MSIFGSIVSKIFGHNTASAAPAATPAPGSPPAAAPASPSPSPSTTSFNNPAGTPPSPGGSATMPAAPSAAAPATQTVDVAEVLNGLAAKNAQKLDWRHSIVDLMKLLDLDSSLSARQGLAKELHYSGSMDDSASMNIWLHKEVMQKLAANGGKVPDDLK